MSASYQLTTTNEIPRVVNLPNEIPRVVNLLPYEIINIIFDFLSQITDNGDSGYYLEVNDRGKIRMLLRPSFTGIFDVMRFKQSVTARYIKLTIQKWTPIGEPVTECSVNALEQPYRIHSQETINANYSNGFISDNRCYTYSDPETGATRIAYIESRNYHLLGNVAFHQGCVYGENGESHVISGFGSQLDGTATIVINPFNMIWDAEDDEHWDEQFEDEEEIDFDALPPLQMYM